jgi:hypothetical protein
LPNRIDETTPTDCLNCGAELRGPFCGACGQRAIPAYPSVREVVGETWEELSGYDGRFARTLRLLLGRPGALTLEVLEGRRVRYISPVRLYLVASVLYFLCAVAVPNLRLTAPAIVPGSGVTIRVDPSGAGAPLSAEDRDRALKEIERAPSWAQAVFRPILLDPAAFRSRFLQTLPRVLFALVPVFAAIVALFYRRRPFSQHLVFAIHLHTFVFMTLTIRELSQLAGSDVVLGLFELAAAVAIAGWSLVAFRRVYREGWSRVVLKGVGVAAVYAVAGLAALVVTLIWAVIPG